MGAVVEVALSKLIYWYDAPRIQTWPTLLAKVDQEEEFSSLTAFGRVVTSERVTDQDHLADHDYVRNFPGLEIKSKRLVLRGVGMLYLENKNYRLSSFARSLAAEYKTNSQSKEWARMLARIVLTREPRTRALFYYLSKPGAVLVFAKQKWFSGGLKQVFVDLGNGQKVYPFSDKDENRINLLECLTENGWWCLGDWRKSNLLKGHGNCKLVGYKNEKISLHRIGQALRPPCEIMHYLGILKFENGECYLDQQAAVEELGEEIASDFKWDAPINNEKLSTKDLVRKYVLQLQGDTGFVVASELRAELVQEGIVNPDREISLLEEAGFLQIEDESFGQGRHGEGLYSDPKKQLIKIRFHQKEI